VGVTLSTGCVGEAPTLPVATFLGPVGAGYAATVAVVIFDHGPFSPRVLIQRAMPSPPARLRGRHAFHGLRRRSDDVAAGVLIHTLLGDGT